MLGDGVRPGGGAVRVAGRRQLVLDGDGEPVVAAGRGEQTAGQQLAEGGVGMGVLGEGRQMRLVRQLAAERDGEAQGLPGGFGQPRGEQGAGAAASPSDGSAASGLSAGSPAASSVPAPGKRP